MPLATRLGDKCTEGKPLSTASPNVFINGIPAGRVTDIYADCGGIITSGSGSVFINGLSAAREGDPTSCGCKVMEHSPNVAIGG